MQYPHEKEAPAARSRGVIALKEENCTVCMLCARSCPDWCIYIEGHKDTAPPRRPGGKPRTVNKLDRFDIDYALCMYCGICVEVCPFDALFWSPEYEYSELRLADLLHDKERLGEWMQAVPDFEPYEAGSEQKVRKVPRSPMVAQNIFFYVIAAVMVAAAVVVVTNRNVVRAGPRPHRGVRRRGRAVHPPGRRVRGGHAGARLHRGDHGADAVRHHARPGPDRSRRRHDQRALVGRRRSRAWCCVGVMGYALIDDFGDDPLPAERQITSVNGSNTATVSDAIFSQYLIPFEVISVLLLAALVGAIVIARKDR